MSKSILILKRDFTALGGAEKYGRRLAHALYRRGDKVTLLTSGPMTDTPPFEVISMPHCPKTSLQTLICFDQFAKYYQQKLKPDAILGLDRNRFQTHLRASSGVHRSYLQHRKQIEPHWKSLRHRINPLHRLLLQMEKSGFEHPKLKTLFTNSNLVKHEILKHYNVDEKKIEVIHNGVEWEQWQVPFDDWPTVYSGHRFEFLFVGNNFERKGLFRLLRGLALLPTKEFHLSVVGRDKHLAKFKSHAKQLGLKSNVTFHGAQQNVTPFYQKADALVIPSYYDPFANVTVEALAMGLFVVSSKTNGGCEVLTPETGTCIEDLSSDEAIAESLSIALKYPKTEESADTIRQKTQYLDFSTQLGHYLERI